MTTPIDALLKRFANYEREELICLIRQGLSIDGEMIPLVVEGGLVDRSVGIDEPPFLTVPDDWHEAFIGAKEQSATIRQMREALKRIAATRPGYEASSDADGLHLAVKEIARTALTSQPTPKGQSK